MTVNLTRANRPSWIETVWAALDDLDVQEQVSTERWQDICTAMAWITEDLGIEKGADGDLIDLLTDGLEDTP